MKLLIVGYGKMGRLIDELASAQGHEVVGRVDEGRDEWAPADAAIDFSTADALLANFPRYLQLRAPLVIGTTGWNPHADRLRAEAVAARLGVVASANFSVGVNLFQLVAQEAARLMREQEQYGAWIHEAHHAAKMDAPSGTARLLFDAMRLAGYSRSIDVSSTRAGHIPGTHVVGFDGASETVTLNHAVRDRAVFAHGALEAAKWLHGKRGWFSMRDMINIS
jgi:4-hydroxy-tetrahydrodipicolinate reductase